MKDRENRSTPNKEFDVPTNSFTSEASYPTETQEKAMYEVLFPVDIDMHIEGIKEFMRGVIKGTEVVHYNWAPEGFTIEIKKYTDEQIEKGEWDQEDLQAAITSVRDKLAEGYFSKASQEFRNLHARPDSIVRLDQEQAIFEDLEAGMPVLIRGNWRIGKTSMALSLAKKRYQGNALFIDAQGYSGSDETIGDFRRDFGAHDIEQFITDREFEGKDIDFNTQRARAVELKEDMKTQSVTPFEYLDKFLEQRKEKAYVAIDEVIMYASEPDKLRYLENLKDFKNMKLAIVLHRIHKYEQLFGKVFEGFKTHFMRELSEQEIATLVRHPLKDTQITFTDGAIGELASFSGGRPMEINNLCGTLMNPDSDDKKLKLVHRASDIQEVASKPLWELKYTFGVAIHTYGRVYSHSMSDSERAIVDELVVKGQLPISSVETEKIQPLIDTTFVRKDEKAGIYSLNGNLFKRVIQDHYFKPL